MRVFARQRRSMFHLAAGLVLALALCASVHAEVSRYVTQWGSRGSGDGQFSNHTGVAVDSSGNVYVADRDNHRIQKFTSTGAFITKWGSSGSGDGQFSYPFGVALDASDNVYVADDQNHRIQKFTSSGTFLTKWGSEGSGSGQLSRPTALSVDTTGNVYVADRGNNRIQKFTSTGTFVTKWGSWGVGNGQLTESFGVAADASGNVYVSDYHNHRIQKFTSTGTFLAKWGSIGSGDGQLYYPIGVAVDASGNVYVSEHSNHRMQKFTSTGTFVAKWGSVGGDNGQFRHPYGVAVDASGYVYVADYTNSRIQKFAPAPSLAWAGTSGYADDGVKPNNGSTSTTFTFKVKYTDALGADPLKATGRIYKRLGPTWKFHRRLDLARGSGNVATGAIYFRGTSLPNHVWKHRFYFEAGDGTPVVGDPPCKNAQGPLIAASAPRLYWMGRDRYTLDGVHPNSGPAGTQFVFKVMYQDSDGQAPETTDLVIERNGLPYKRRTMTTGASGDYRIGKIYRRPVKITQSGTYRYRFSFVQGGRTATGTPAANRSGPNITESGALVVSGLSSVPTTAGAQLTFTLSSAAQVEARVLNIAGRPVKTICSGRDCQAGANTLLWNAMSDSGTRAPNGVYVVEVAAKGEDGGQTRALTQVRIGR